MASNNTIKTRIQLKSDTEENWKKSVLESDGGLKVTGTSFVPLLGELIVYTADDTHPFSRLKIGDGNTNVVRLPFIDAGTIDGNDLPESQISVHATRQQFPIIGEPNKLYIDLAKNIIYCYTDAGGYTQLSNFTFSLNLSNTSVSNISNWTSGRITQLNSNDGILQVTNGVLPVLNYYGVSVLTNVELEKRGET